MKGVRFRQLYPMRQALIPAEVGNIRWNKFYRHIYTFSAKLIAVSRKPCNFVAVNNDHLNRKIMNKNARPLVACKARTIITVLLALVAMTISAQEKLIRIDSKDITWQKDNPQYFFFNKEKARLLMPQAAEFGVECIPSFAPEWSLTYDSVAQALIYNEAQESIWHSTYDAMYKKKTITKNGRKIVKRELRKHPKDYVAPDVKTYSLTISIEQAQMLKAICSVAIGTSEPREDSMLGHNLELFHR